MSVSSTNKTDRHDITKILLKVALNTICSEVINCTQCKTASVRKTHEESYHLEIMVFNATFNNILVRRIGDRLV
jgi:hypothetical protein